MYKPLNISFVCWKSHGNDHDACNLPIFIGAFHFQFALVDLNDKSFCNHWLQALKSYHSYNHLGNLVDLSRKALLLFIHLSLTLTYSCLIFTMPTPNEVHQVSDSLSSKWFGIDACHVAICWHLHHIEVFSILNP